MRCKNMPCHVSDLAVALPDRVFSFSLPLAQVVFSPRHVRHLQECVAAAFGPARLPRLSPASCESAFASAPRSHHSFVRRPVRWSVVAVDTQRCTPRLCWSTCLQSCWNWSVSVTSCCVKPRRDCDRAAPGCAAMGQRAVVEPSAHAGTDASLHQRPPASRPGHGRRARCAPLPRFWMRLCSWACCYAIGRAGITLGRCIIPFVESPHNLEVGCCSRGTQLRFIGASVWRATLWRA